MLQITADVFSGRSNPAWLITDEQEARTTLRELAKERNLLTQSVPAEAGLGLRGFIIEILDDELARDLTLSPSLYLAAGAQARSTRANELAERLINLMDRAKPPSRAAEDALRLDADLRNLLTTQLERVSRTSIADALAGPAAAAPEEIGEAGTVTCTIELAAYNPGFWNNDPVVQYNNNCYNYASNWRTNTFAQPGRGCGQIYTSITCSEVTRAALCDGMHRRYDCFPDSERPRYLVALMIWPGQDYHWMRKMKENFWGHKPGGTPVRNVDSSGNVISDPATCDRGPYTEFCGYFYGCNSQRQRIR